MNQKLVRKIKKYNPKWSQEILAFLRCKIDHLTSSSIDEGEYDEPKFDLDMNKTDRCLVGEVHRFTFGSDSCEICDRYSMSFFRNNDTRHKALFDEELEDFYDHIESYHPELIK